MNSNNVTLLSKIIKANTEYLENHANKKNISTSVDLHYYIVMFEAKATCEHQH